MRKLQNCEFENMCAFCARCLSSSSIALSSLIQSRTSRPLSYLFRNYAVNVSSAATTTATGSEYDKRDAMPISEAEFNQLMTSAKIAPNSRIGLAVSGGPDSMALALLLQRWNLEHPSSSIVAIIVDHKLRTESTEEANLVSSWLKARGIKVVQLSLGWKDGHPKTAIMERAREQRYQVLRTFCTRAKLNFLCTAHHIGDQAETFLLRFARGSGISGLSCMAISRQLQYHSKNPIKLVRPLLPVEKERLIATCESMNQNFVIDPSNFKREYTRVKVRNALKALNSTETETETDNKKQDWRVSPQSLYTMAEYMQQTTHVLKNQVAAGIERCLIHEKTMRKLGVAILDKQALLSEPKHIGIRVFAESLRVVGGQQTPLRLEALERFWKSLKTQTTTLTLGACLIFPWRLSEDEKELIFICPELLEPHKPFENGREFFVSSSHPCTIRFDWRFVLHVTSSNSEYTRLAIRRMAPGDKKLIVNSHGIQKMRKGWPSSFVWALPVIEVEHFEEKELWCPHLSKKFHDLHVAVTFDPIPPSIQ